MKPSLVSIFGHRSLAIFFVLCVGLAVSASAQTDAPAERKPWNPEEMQSLTSQLVNEIGTVRKEARKEPHLQNPQRPGGQKVTSFMENLRLLENSAKQLASRVKSGGGFEETQGIARKFGVLLRDSEVLGRSLNLSASITRDLEAAQRTLNKLAPYYGAKPLYPKLESAGDA